MPPPPSGTSIRIHGSVVNITKEDLKLEIDGEPAAWDADDQINGEPTPRSMPRAINLAHLGHLDDDKDHQLSGRVLPEVAGVFRIDYFEFVMPSLKDSMLTISPLPELNMEVSMFSIPGQQLRTYLQRPRLWIILTRRLHSTMTPNGHMI